MKAIIAATVFGIIMMFAGFVVKEKRSLVAVATTLFFLLLGVNVWELFSAAPGTTVPFFNFQLTIGPFALWFNTPDDRLYGVVYIADRQRYCQGRRACRRVLRIDSCLYW